MRRLDSQPERTGEPHIVCFDIETRKLASDVGGWDRLTSGSGGLACAIVWDSRCGCFHVFDEDTLEDMAALLETADCVLSFNGERFDVPFVEGCLGRRLALGNHVDLLSLIRRTVGLTKGYSLDAISLRTLGRGKSGSGTNAPKLFEEGRLKELHQYCRDDVHLTLSNFIFAQEHGGIIGVNGQLLELPLPEWLRTH